MNPYRKKLDRLLAERRQLLGQLKTDEAALKDAKDALQAALEAQKNLQALAEGVQQQAHTEIAKVVTRCLQSVGWDYTFRLIFEQSRGKTTARPAFFRNEYEVDPVEAAGGGPLDVAAFAMRLAALQLKKPARARELYLDEPFKNVHGEHYRQRLADLLPKLSEEMDVRIVMVTGLDWLRIGKVIKL